MAGPFPSRAQGETGKATLANAVTIAGYASTLAWLAGGSPWYAVAGIVADELDGAIARNMGQASEFGSLLDWGVDMTLTGAVALGVGSPVTLALLPVTTATQVVRRERGERPKLGSARAFMTAVALWQTKFKPLR